jgi:hypothetical protein
MFTASAVTRQRGNDLVQGVDTTHAPRARVTSHESRPKLASKPWQCESIGYCDGSARMPTKGADRRRRAVARAFGKQQAGSRQAVGSRQARARDGACGSIRSHGGKRQIPPIWRRRVGGLHEGLREGSESMCRIGTAWEWKVWAAPFGGKSELRLVRE